jgi:hypothetical protein
LFTKYSDFHLHATDKYDSLEALLTDRNAVALSLMSAFPRMAVGSFFEELKSFKENEEKARARQEEETSEEQKAVASNFDADCEHECCKRIISLILTRNEQLANQVKELAKMISAQNKIITQNQLYVQNEFNKIKPDEEKLATPMNGLLASGMCRPISSTRHPLTRATLLVSTSWMHCLVNMSLDRIDLINSFLSR